MSALDALARDPRLGSARIHVCDAADDQVVFDFDGRAPAPTASVLKVLTGAAALAVLGPDFRMTTRVVAGRSDAEHVLVGAGDATLSATPVGAVTCYPGAARVAELADALRTRAPVRRLVCDASLFGGPTWLEGWDEQLERVEDGSISHITALQLDGDREDPAEPYSPRSADPVMRAGRAVADALGIPDVEIGRAPSGAAVLAEVASPPLHELIAIALAISDNTLMEMLARLTAIASGTGDDFAAVDPAVRAALAGYGLPVQADRIADGSGLSPETAVSPRYVARFMARVRRRERGLGVIDDALTVSGRPSAGTFGTARFQGANAVVGDAVHAKTGFIEGAYTLAGYVHTTGSRTLAFAVFAIGEVDGTAKDAIDDFVVALHRDDDAVRRAA